MTKHRQDNEKIGKASRTDIEGIAATGINKTALETFDITPGRAPAEGPATEILSPSHERWEQRTAERAPAEGPELPTPSPKK